MSELYDQARKFRDDLLRREQAAADDLVTAYGQAWTRISGQLRDLQAEIAAARARGEEITPSWLLRAERLATLQAQVEAEIGKFAAAASERIRTEQAVAVEAAQRDAETLAGIGRRQAERPVVQVTFNRIPREAMADLVGFTSSGSPLRALLDELPGSASASVRRALITGLATGQNPRATAREIRKDLGGDLNRALTIARTETLRAYRESTRRGYAENGFEEWIWLASFSGRTCPACLAMNGTRHPVSEPLDGHPNCRCTMVPVTGYDLKIRSGAEWLTRQKPEVQERVLGKAGAQAWRDGEVILKDFVGRRTSAKWGTMRYARSLRRAREEAEQRGKPP